MLDTHAGAAMDQQVKVMKLLGIGDNTVDIDIDNASSFRAEMQSMWPYLRDGWAVRHPIWAASGTMIGPCACFLH